MKTEKYQSKASPRCSFQDRETLVIKQLTHGNESQLDGVRFVTQLVAKFNDISTFPLA